MLKKLKLVRKNSGKLAATSTIALLGFGLANQGTVQADEVTVAPMPTEPSATASSTVEVVPTTIAEANALVVNAQADADSASDVFSTKESQLASQSEELELSTSEVATLEEQLVSAIAEHSEAIAIKSEGSSEHISELTSELSSVKETYTSESVVNVTNQSVADSQSNTVASASAVASEASRSASEAAAKVDKLTSLVNSPEKVSTDLANAKSEVSRLEREVSAAEKAVTSATATAKAELAKKLASKQEELSQKQSELNKLKADKTVIKAPSVTGSNKIVLPSTYKTIVYPALKDIENSGWTFSAGYNTSVSRLKGRIESGVQSSVYGVSYNGTGVNSYKTIAADRTRYIDPNNLSTAVQNELAQFTGELLNEVRSQLGLTTLTVTKTAQEFAAAIASDYRRTGFGRMSNPHSSSIIGHNAQSVGLAYSDNRGYESLGFFGNARTVDQLKNYFYNSIVYMLFNDVTSNYGHTISLLQNSNNGPYYLGVSSTSDAQHIYVIPSANVRSARFSTASLTAVKTVDNSAKISAVQAAMATIQSEIGRLKAQGSTVASSTLVVRAKDKLKSLNQQLAGARDNYRNLSKLKTQLAANKTKLMTQLEEAKQVNAIRLQEKVIAQDNLTKELKKYQVLQAAAVESKAKISALKDRIAQLTKNLQKYNDPELVSRTEANVRNLKTKLQVATVNLEVNVKALQLLKDDLATAAKGYDSAKENLLNSKLLLETLIAENDHGNSDAVFSTVSETQSNTSNSSSASRLNIVERSEGSSSSHQFVRELASLTTIEKQVTHPAKVGQLASVASDRMPLEKFSSLGSQNVSSQSEKMVVKSDVSEETKQQKTALTKTSSSKSMATAVESEPTSDKVVATTVVAGATMVTLAAMALSKKRYK